MSWLMTMALSRLLGIREYIHAAWITFHAITLSKCSSNPFMYNISKWNVWNISPVSSIIHKRVKTSKEIEVLNLK